MLEAANADLVFTISLKRSTHRTRRARQQMRDRLRHLLVDLAASDARRFVGLGE